MTRKKYKPYFLLLVIVKMNELHICYAFNCKRPTIDKEQKCQRPPWANCMRDFHSRKKMSVNTKQI